MIIVMTPEIQPSGSHYFYSCSMCTIVGVNLKMADKLIVIDGMSLLILSKIQAHNRFEREWLLEFVVTF